MTAYVYSHSLPPCVLLSTFGSTAPGPLYYVNFQDEAGNVCNTGLAKPRVMSSYHKTCTLIDDRNHLRQHCLQIERLLPTFCPFLKVATTFVGEYAVDVYHFVKFLKVLDFEAEHIDTIEDFMDWLCSILFLEDAKQVDLAAAHSILVQGSVRTLEATAMKASKLQNPGAPGAKAKKPKHKQKACRMCGPKRNPSGGAVQYKHMVQYVCPVRDCGAGLCSPQTGRHCFRKHLKDAHGICDECTTPGLVF
jgi:hypothetical protein